jgi:hypothetical protein
VRPGCSPALAPAVTVGLYLLEQLQVGRRLAGKETGDGGQLNVVVGNGLDTVSNVVDGGFQRTGIDGRFAGLQLVKKR